MTTDIFVSLDAINRLMEEKNIDNKGLAEIMKISMPSVRRILRNVRQSQIPIKTAFKLARALEVDILALSGRTGSELE